MNEILVQIVMAAGVATAVLGAISALFHVAAGMREDRRVAEAMDSASAVAIYQSHGANRKPVDDRAQMEADLLDRPVSDWIAEAEADALRRYGPKPDPAVIAASLHPDPEPARHVHTIDVIAADGTPMRCGTCGWVRSA